jgi:uncharacterized SAM-binding protein YcdF (DUF218 family)
MTGTEVDAAAQIIWDYMRMEQAPVKSDAIFVLCSFDTRVADYAAKLFKQNYGDYLVFSGSGKGRLTEKLFDKSEAETFADIAIAAGVPKDHIIIENQATNTGENIRFTYDLLRQKELHPQSLLVLQKPYMVRRTYATFRKQWPEPTTSITVTSPPVAYDDYFNATNPKQYVLESMVGDLQRIKLYGSRGFQIPQEIPAEVELAYQQLVTAGFTRRVLSE